jgi:hypothetical protein
MGSPSTNRPSKPLSRKPFMSKKAIRESLITVLLVLFVFCIVAVRKSDQAALTQGHSFAAAETKMPTARSSIAGLNGSLPAMIDSQTMMTRIEIGAAVDTYYLKTVNFPSRRLGREFFARAQEIVGRRNCEDNEIRLAYDHGKSTRYVVSGSDNIEAGFFVISNVYCQRFRAPKDSTRLS